MTLVVVAPRRIPIQLLAVALLLVVLAFPRTVSAQPAPATPAQPVTTPAPPPPPAKPTGIEAFLEQRVVEELASDGIVLSRLGMVLDIELIGERALVSLVDTATQRAAASTKVDVLPADRDAAVAVVKQVAASLAAQLGAARTPASQPAPTTADVLAEVRAESDQRQRAEMRFKTEAIGFGEEIIVSGYVSDGTGGVSSRRKWFPTRGELRLILEPEEFYKLVERPDLFAAYNTRRQWKIGTSVAFVALLGLSGYLAVQSIPGDCSGDEGCSLNTGYLVAAGVALVGSTGAVIVALHLHANPHPISESKAKEFAQAYNDRLRKQLGLPTAARLERPKRWVRELAWAPYASPGGGGLVLGGRF